MSDPTLQSVLSTLLSALLVGFGLLLLLRRLGRTHPGLAIGIPVAVGVAARLATILAVDGTGLSEKLRGGDEATFLGRAEDLGNLPLAAPEWTTTLTQDFHTAVFGLQVKLLAFTPTPMRIVQVGIAMVGLLLLIAAVHEMAGPRASRLGAWLLMLEPAAIFFGSAIHKEPFMQFACGVLVYGTVRLWRDLEFRGIALAAAGCAVAIATRVYAGWFLVCGCVLVAFHGAFRRLDRPMRALPVIAAVIVGVILATPLLLQISTPERLQRLQISHDYNASADTRVQPGDIDMSSGNQNNLALERVDFSTREQIILNLPQRIRDITLRPYPWQVQNASQTLGAIGSLVALGVLGLLLSYAWRARGRVLHLTAPLLYPFFFLLVASALSAGNAGTSFRYRTHVVMLALAMLVVLRAHTTSEKVIPRAARRRSGRRVIASAGPTGAPQPVA